MENRERNGNKCIKVIPLNEVKNKIMLKVGLSGNSKLLKPIKSIAGVNKCTHIQSFTNTKQRALLMKTVLKESQEM